MARVRMHITEVFEYDVYLNELDPEVYQDTSSVEAVVQQDIEDLQSGEINAWDLSMEGPQVEEVSFEIIEPDDD